MLLFGRSLLTFLLLFQIKKQFCLGFISPTSNLAARTLTAVSTKPSSHGRVPATILSVAITHIDKDDENDVLPVMKTNEVNDPLLASSTDSDNNVANGSTNISSSRSARWKKALTSAFWITGCALGGGFLALPNLLVAQKIGFLSSTCTMTCLWIYFWAQFILLMDCLSIQPSLRGLARDTLGSFGQTLVSTLLGLLTFTTLVSQISRAGRLMKETSISSLGFIGNLPYPMTCFITATSLALPVFFRRQKEGGTNNKLNNFLVSTMIFFATLVFVRGNHQVAWSQLFQLSSEAESVSSFVSTWFRSLPHALPTLMQIMVYGEIIPIIAPIIQSKDNSDGGKDDVVQRKNFAVAFGSFLPLCLLVGWSALGLAFLTSSTPRAGMGDPVKVLLQQHSSPIRIPLIGLAWSAIFTTILSCYMALNNLYQDIFVNKTGNEKVKKIAQKKRFHIHTIVPALGIVLPACTIASTSPDIFFKAVSFGGSYPVLWLWGVLPPIMALRQAKLLKSKWNISKKIRVWVLLSLSLAMVAMNVIPDIRWLFSKLLV